MLIICPPPVCKWRGGGVVWTPTLPSCFWCPPPPPPPLPFLLTLSYSLVFFFFFFFYPLSCSAASAPPFQSGRLSGRLLRDERTGTVAGSLWCGADGGREGGRGDVGGVSFLFLFYHLCLPSWHQVRLFHLSFHQFWISVIVTSLLEEVNQSPTQWFIAEQQTWWTVRQQSCDESLIELVIIDNIQPYWHT